jgi:hypothetical protein
VICGPDVLIKLYVHQNATEKRGKEKEEEEGEINKKADQQ